MNNDGKLDLVVANYGSNNISVLFGTGVGTFTGQTAYAVGSNANDITIADFNNDGFKDVAVAVWNNFVRVFNGSSTGSLTSSTNYIVTSVPGGITSGDFNNDGSIDLAISCAFSSNLAIKLNTGTGSFGTSTYYNIGWDNRTIIAGDYNGDGNIDIATGDDQGIGSMQIFNGNGLGGFAAASHYIMGEAARSIASGDFNADGKPDFASASSHYISVLLTSSMPTISVSGPTVTCAYAPLTLTATGATGYYWSGMSAGAGASVVYYPSANSVYTITGINSPACPVISIKTVSVIPSPTVLISSVSNSVCSGSIINLMASGAVSYTWSNGSNNSLQSLTPSITSAFTVTGTGSNACKDTAVKLLTVYPQPTITVTGASSICANGSATLSVIGATSYTWSVATSGSSIVVNPTTTTCYSVIGTSTAGCTNLAAACITVVPLPNIIINPATTSVCLGTSQTFTASGATSYTWLPNVNTVTYNVSPLNNTTYTLLGEMNGCNNTTAVTLSVNPTCSDVWPGDANSDGIVDATDILEIGLSFLSTGAPRPVQGNNYSPYFATNFTGTGSTGKNKCHIDCDGDGLINFADTIAIANNFSLTHNFKPSNTSSTPDISLVSLNGNLIAPGAWNTLDVYLSDTTAPVSVYGTAFDVLFDQALIETNAANVYYTSSFLKNNNVNVDFRKVNFPFGKVACATVRTDATNAIGGGKIGEFHFKLKTGVADGTILNVSIGNSIKVLANGTTSPLNSNSLQLSVSSALGIKDNVLSRIYFYPNPAVNTITFVAPALSAVNYEITDVSGRVVTQGTFSERKSVDISTIASGSYILIFKTGSQISYRKLLIQN